MKRRVGLSISSLILISIIMAQAIWGNSYEPRIQFYIYQSFGIILTILFLIFAITKTDSIINNITISFISLVFIFLLVEAVLSLTDYTVIRPEPSIIEHCQEDEILRWRCIPNSGEFDANGWRNPIALDVADIVVLGDSQTFGYNAGLYETWPAFLQSALGDEIGVYNMGISGYGISDYYALMDEALAYMPKKNPGWGLFWQ